MDKIIVALIGLISGSIGSLFAPWARWGIEKCRIKQKRRIELINEWRTILNTPNFKRRDLLEHTSYGPLWELLKENVKQEIERFESLITIALNSLVSNHGKDLLLKEIARIEKEWDLI